MVRTKANRGYIILRIPTALLLVYLQTALDESRLQFTIILMNLDHDLFVGRKTKKKEIWKALFLDFVLKLFSRWKKKAIGRSQMTKKSRSMDTISIKTKHACLLVTICDIFGRLFRTEVFDNEAESDSNMFNNTDI